MFRNLQKKILCVIIFTFYLCILYSDVKFDDIYDVFE